MIDNKNIFENDKFRDILNDSKLTASEHLKYRIMHQIETEQALIPKKVKSNKPLITSVLSIATVMYILLAAIAVGTYVIGGFDALLSVEFLLPAIIIAASGTIFGLVIVLDEQRYRS